MTPPSLLLLVMLAVTSMPIKADKSPNPAAISYSGCSLKQPLNCNSHSDSDIQMGECWSNARVMHQQSAFFVPFKPGEKSYHSEGGPYGTCTAYACFPSENDMQEESNLSNFCFFWDGKDHTVIPNGGLSRRGLYERDGTASDDGDPNTSQNMTTTADPSTTPDPTTPDPTTTDPTTTDPTTTDPTSVDPTTVDPTTTDPTTTDPTTVDPTTTDPTTVDPTTADPTTVDPTNLDPNSGTAPDPTTGNNATSTGTGTGTSSGTKGHNKYKHKKMKKVKKAKKAKKTKKTKKPKKPKTTKTKTKKKEKSASSTGGSGSSSQSSNSSMPNAPGKVVIPIPMICPSNLANCYSANYFEKGGKLEVYANLIPTYDGLWFPPKNKNHEFMFCKGLGLGCPTPTMQNLQLQHIGDQHCDTSKCKVPPNSN